MRSKKATRAFFIVLLMPESSLKFEFGSVEKYWRHLVSHWIRKRSPLLSL